MNMKRMILGGVLTAATFAFLMGAVIDLGSLVSFGGTLTGNVVANANVLSTCYIGLSNTVVTFTPLAPTQNTLTTSNAVTVFDNGGNAASTILISGGTGNALNAQTGTGNWIGVSANNANTIYITNTVFSSSSATNYWAATAITPSLASTSITLPAPTIGTPNTVVTVWLGMGIPPAQHPDTYTANIVLETTC